MGRVAGISLLTSGSAGDCYRWHSLMFLFFLMISIESLFVFCRLRHTRYNEVSASDLGHRSFQVFALAIVHKDPLCPMSTASQFESSAQHEVFTLDISERRGEMALATLVRALSGLKTKMFNSSDWVSPREYSPEEVWMEAFHDNALYVVSTSARDRQINFTITQQSPHVKVQSRSRRLSSGFRTLDNTARHESASGRT